MYVPEHFREDDPQRIRALLRDYSFGVLVTVAEGAPFASHLPFIYEPDRGTRGMLSGHMARANPQWRHLVEAPSVLAMFEGPHTYVSPSWYSQFGVPTWNYAVAHVYGKPKVLDDTAQVGAIVERLTAIHEAGFAEPWKADLSEARTGRMLEFIVGFEIEVTAVEAKFKLSQNRSVEDRKRVIAKLEASDSQTDHAVAELMAAALKRGAK